MVQVTEIEYETTEREVTRFKCENCGYIGEEEEFSTVDYHDTTDPSSIDHPDKREHRCEKCVGINKRLEVDAKKEYLESFWKGTKDRLLIPLFLIPGFIIGFWTGQMGMMFREFMNLEPWWVGEVLAGFMVFLITGVIAIIIIRAVLEALGIEE